MIQILLKLSSKIKNRNGFSLAEALVSVLILLMVSSVVAAGIPVAQRAYFDVTNSANAQLMLSTTITSIRTELGKARDVRVTSTAAGDEGQSVTRYAIQYTSHNGGPSELLLRTTAFI